MRLTLTENILMLNEFLIHLSFSAENQQVCWLISLEAMSSKKVHFRDLCSASAPFLTKNYLFEIGDSWPAIFQAAHMPSIDSIGSQWK